MNTSQIQKLILQISLPVIVFALLMQIAPFIFSDLFPSITRYVFSFFLLLYILFIVPYFFRQNDRGVIELQNLFIILSGTAGLVFLGVACINSLFLVIGVGSVPMHLLLSVIYASAINSILIIILIAIRMKLGQLFVEKKA